MSEINQRPVNWTPVGKSIIESIIGFEKGIIDMYYKYHSKYPNAFLSESEEQINEEYIK